MFEHFQSITCTSTTMQGLKNVSLKLRGELITQSRYPISRCPQARLPTIYHSMSQMADAFNLAKNTTYSSIRSQMWQSFCMTTHTQWKCTPQKQIKTIFHVCGQFHSSFNPNTCYTKCCTEVFPTTYWTQTLSITVPKDLVHVYKKP
jgi:hypothetical protein